LLLDRGATLGQIGKRVDAPRRMNRDKLPNPRTQIEAGTIATSAPPKKKVEKSGRFSSLVKAFRDEFIDPPRFDNPPPQLRGIADAAMAKASIDRPDSSSRVSASSSDTQVHQPQNTQGPQPKYTQPLPQPPRPQNSQAPQPEKKEIKKQFQKRQLRKTLRDEDAKAFGPPPPPR